MAELINDVAIGGTQVIELNTGALVAPDMSIDVKEPKDNDA